MDSTATSVDSYAVSENEKIMFTSHGIIDVKNNQTDSPLWILSYQEIAKRLNIDTSKVKNIQITRDQILSNGLWRFAVAFDGQETGSEYYIDVNIRTGNIDWTQSITDMSHGNFNLIFSL